MTERSARWSTLSKNSPAIWKIRFIDYVVSTPNSASFWDTKNISIFGLISSVMIPQNNRLIVLHDSIASCCTEKNEERGFTTWSKELDPAGMSNWRGNSQTRNRPVYSLVHLVNILQLQMIPVSFHVDQSSFSLEFDAVITLQQYGAYFTVMMKNDSYR